MENLNEPPMLQNRYFRQCIQGGGVYFNQNRTNFGKSRHKCRVYFAKMHGNCEIKEILKIKN